MKTPRGRATIALIRRVAAALRGEPQADESLLGSLLRGRQAHVPEDLVGVGLAVWQARGGRLTPDSPAWRDDLREVLGRGPAFEAANIEALRSIAAWAEAQPGSGRLPPVMLGDAAVLHGLYGCWDAFRASLWVIALDADDTAGAAVTGAFSGAPPDDFRFGGLGPLAGYLDRWTADVEIGGTRWLMPTGELLVMLLAARVGDPEALPMPPAWFHLAVALLAWHGRVSARLALGLAGELGVQPHVARGLAIVGEMLPEVRRVLPKGRLEIPMWERLLAVPVAARRVVRETIRRGDAEGDDE
jgi:hypothetical protein